MSRDEAVEQVLNKKFTRKSDRVKLSDEIFDYLWELKEYCEIKAWSEMLPEDVLWVFRRAARIRGYDVEREHEDDRIAAAENFVWTAMDMAEGNV